MYLCILFSGYDVCCFLWPGQDVAQGHGVPVAAVVFASVCCTGAGVWLYIPIGSLAEGQCCGRWTGGEQVAGGRVDGGFGNSVVGVVSRYLIQCAEDRIVCLDGYHVGEHPQFGTGDCRQCFQGVYRLDHGFVGGFGSEYWEMCFLSLYGAAGGGVAGSAGGYW